MAHIQLQYYLFYFKYVFNAFSLFLIIKKTHLFCNTLTYTSGTFIFVIKYWKRENTNRLELHTADASSKSY